MSEAEALRYCPHCGDKMNYLNYKKHLHLNCITLKEEYKHEEDE